MERPGARGNPAREELDAGSREEGPAWPQCPCPGAAAARGRLWAQSRKLQEGLNRTSVSFVLLSNFL